MESDSLLCGFCDSLHWVGGGLMSLVTVDL